MQATKALIGNYPVYAVIPAKDIDRAKQFYGQTLGLETRVVGPPEAGMFTVTAGNGTVFTVYKTDATSSATVANFTVDDIDAVVQDLRDRGVKLGEYDMPGLKTVNGIATYPDGTRSAWLIDSEGNAISIATM